MPTIRETYREAARRRGLPTWIVQQIEAESGFNPRAVSPAGALGSAQFMPETGARYGLEGKEFFDPHESADAWARHMVDLRARAQEQGLSGDAAIKAALVGYNAGERRMDRYIADVQGGREPRIPRETRGYLKAAMPEIIPLPGRDVRESEDFEPIPLIKPLPERESEDFEPIPLIKPLAKGQRVPPGKAKKPSMPEQEVRHAAPEEAPIQQQPGTLGRPPGVGGLPAELTQAPITMRSVAEATGLAPILQTMAKPFAEVGTGMVERVPELGEGVRQAYLKAFGGPEEYQAYTEELRGREEERGEKPFLVKLGRAMTDVGEAMVLSRAGGAIGGGLYGALQPVVGEDENFLLAKGKQVGQGVLLGAIADKLAGLLGKAMPRPEIEHFKAAGIPYTAAQVSKSPAIQESEAVMMRAYGKAGERLRKVIGTQQEKMKALVKPEVEITAADAGKKILEALPGLRVAPESAWKKIMLAMTTEEFNAVSRHLVSKPSVLRALKAQTDKMLSRKAISKAEMGYYFSPKRFAEVFDDIGEAKLRLVYGPDKMKQLRALRDIGIDRIEISTQEAIMAKSHGLINAIFPREGISSIPSNIVRRLAYRTRVGKHISPSEKSLRGLEGAKTGRLPAAAAISAGEYQDFPQKYVEGQGWFIMDATGKWVKMTP